MNWNNWQAIRRHPRDGRPCATSPATALATNKPLLFAHDGLPAGAEQALELLLAHLGDNRPAVGWIHWSDGAG